jgi:tetratricopeptide (TPR) repeat protein
MSDAFLSSEDFAERAHQLYNEGRFDDALTVLREGLGVYPFSAELHVGVGYARFAREEYAWARQSFDDALGFDPEHEDGLVGLGEVLLKLGECTEALKCFEQVLVLGFRDDHDLVLQAGRALFRENAVQAARHFFQVAVETHPESGEAVACLGYAQHRLGKDADAMRSLRKALELDPGHSEARIYLGNLLYDRGEFESALYHFEQTRPDDHVDELAIWRMLELKKSIYRLGPGDPEFVPWNDRLGELATACDAIDQLLAEVEATQADGGVRDPLQLELFGALLQELDGMRRQRGVIPHRVLTRDGESYTGSWDEIIEQMHEDDPVWRTKPRTGYMEHLARQGRDRRGVSISTNDAEAFLLGIAAAGMLRIVR